MKNIIFAIVFILPAIVSAELAMWHGYIVSGNSRNIVRDGKIQEFGFSKKSDVSAVRSLDALGEHVTSVNAYESSGILVFGTYYAESKEFELKDWRIVSPFFVRDNEAGVVKRDSLKESDFSFDDTSWIVEFFGEEAVKNAVFDPLKYVLLTKGKD